MLGCVLISTCNRTEIYPPPAGRGAPDPAALLCAAAGQEHAPFSHAFVTRRGEDAARHLCEVAAGLKSQIWGEDQIVSQVKTAIAAAREFGGADSVLETLFRTAVSAAKEVKTNVRLTGGLPTRGPAGRGVLELELGRLGGQDGPGHRQRRWDGWPPAFCGRRVRRDGDRAVLPPRGDRGAQAAPSPPYEERYAAMERAQVLVSSPPAPTLP